jgi:hypothetical protein
MNGKKTIRDALLIALAASGRVNRTVQVQPAVVLWTDADRQWANVASRLRGSDLDLFFLGSYDPQTRQGPAIWLKCAIAGAIEGARKSAAPPIIYLAGISRTDLRAIETCPRELQPLAELQYRGVFWTQTNGKDWTVQAFLGSKHGGLGLEITQDKPTHDALHRLIEADLFLDQPLEQFESHRIDVGWLDSLLAPNPARDVLIWLNDPQKAERLWAGARWELFIARCKKEFKFDPIKDGRLAGADQLARHVGAWQAVWDLYRDAYSSFPYIVEALLKVQVPPKGGLFDDLSAYPRANDDAETTLRYELNALAGKPLSQARAAVVEAEKAHADRREWLWSRMGRAPLSNALRHLADLVECSGAAIAGASPDAMALQYAEKGWRVDLAAMKALGAVALKPDTDAVSSALRAIYVPWLEQTASKFQDVVASHGGLPLSTPLEPLPGMCTIFVDGLRYDVARELMTRLEALGEVSVKHSWTTIPSVTASGKPWASPVRAHITGSKNDDEFQPRVAKNEKLLSSHTFRQLLVEHGTQYLGSSEVGDPSGIAWTECGDLDHYGHEHGLRLARDLDAQLSQIVERVAELRDAAWRHFQIVTDHGWLLVPGDLPKAELQKHEVQTRWGRCAVLKQSASGAHLTFPWSWAKEVQVAIAPGICSFIAGQQYAHGGLTLQESLVPLVELHVDSQGKRVQVDITSVSWRGLRCHAEIEPSVAGLTLDVRTKVAAPEASVVEHRRPFVNGKASVAVRDDSDAGKAAFVLVLDAQDNVVQKAQTTIGE